MFDFRTILSKLSSNAAVFTHDGNTKTLYFGNKGFLNIFSTEPDVFLQAFDAMFSENGEQSKTISINGQNLQLNTCNLENNSYLVEIIETSRVFTPVKENKPHWAPILNEFISVGIYRAEKNGKFTEVNQVFLDFLGYASLEAVNNELVTNDSSPLLNLLEKNDNSRVRFRIEKADGKLVFIDKQSRAICDANNEILFIEGFFIEATEKVILENRLQNERRMMQLAINSVPDAIYVKDLEGKKILANLSDAKNMGMQTVDEAIGKTDFDVYPTEVARNFRADDLYVLQSESPVINREELLINSKKEKRWLLTTKIPMRDASGKVSGIIGIGRDVTGIKTVQDALKENEEKYRTLVEQAFDGIVIVHKGTITYTNNSFERMLGYSSQELKNFTFINLIQDSEAGKSRLCSMISDENSETSVSIEACLTAKNNEQIIVHINAGLMRHQGKMEHMLVIRDITEQTMFVSELKKYAEKLRELNAQKDKFFSIIAHDLKSPFLALLNYPEILVTEIDTLSKPEILDIGTKIRDLANKVYSLIENLLEWSRLQTGRIQFEPADLDVHSKVQSVFELLSANALNKKITLTNNVPPELSVFVDDNVLQSVLQNLVTNAIKFSYANGNILISAAKENEHIKISVTDNGVGITDEMRKKLFRLDEHLSTIGTGNETGTGLGLIYCQELIKKSGGEIAIIANTGSGTTVVFTLPVKNNL